jgi:hypothetical protein
MLKNFLHHSGHRQGTWARSNVEKAHAFTQHLANVFQLQPSENEPKEEEALIHLLETYQLNQPSNISKVRTFKKSSAI